MNIRKIDHWFREHILTTIKISNFYTAHIA